LTDPISPVPRLDLRQVSAKTSPIRGAEQNKGGCVLDHPGLDLPAGDLPVRRRHELPRLDRRPPGRVEKPEERNDGIGI
jgi:hypothetical protein